MASVRRDRLGGGPPHLSARARRDVRAPRGSGWRRSSPSCASERRSSPAAAARRRSSGTDSPGKLTARERVDRLLDPSSSFLELNALAAWDLYDGAAPSARIVTGIGVVEAKCVVVANDATVKSGSLLPLTVKKHLRARGGGGAEPPRCVYLVDSGGAFLPLQAEVFPDRDHFRRIF